LQGRQAPERGRKSTATGHPAPPKAKRAGPSAEHMDLGEGRNHVRGGRVVKVTATSPYRNPTPQPVTEAPKQLQVTATRNRKQKSVTHQLNEWRNDQWSTTLEFLDPEDQSLWGMTKWMMRVPTPSPPRHPDDRSLRL
jgi:hypothetical protein